jgi:hypothetical protein
MNGESTNRFPLWKTARVAAVIFGIITVVAIGGCFNAKHEYQDYVKKMSGFGAFVESFLRGVKGDLTMPFEVQHKIEELEATWKTWRIWASLFFALTSVTSWFSLRPKAQSPVPPDHRHISSPPNSIEVEQGELGIPQRRINPSPPPDSVDIGTDELDIPPRHLGEPPD